MSPTAIQTLRDLSGRPAPPQSVNPGLANRLERESLVEEVALPSPYATHKGRNISHLKITAAGIERLAELGQS